MRPCVVLNDYSKYADDGDLVVPSVNTDTIQIEVDNITKWTELNNLKLNGIKLRNWSFINPDPKLIVYLHHLPQALKECQHLMFSGSFWMKLWHSGNILSRGLCTALPLLCTPTPWRCCGLGVWVGNNFGMWPLRHWLRVCSTLLLFGGGSSMRALVMKLRLSFGD